MPPPPPHLSFVGGAPPYSRGAGIAPSTRLHGAGYLCYSLLLPSGPVCHQALSKGGPFPWPVNSFSISCLVYSCTTVCVPVVWRFQTTWEVCHMGNMPHGKYATWEIHGRSYLVVFHHSIINVVLEPKKPQNIHFFTFAQVTTKTCCNYIVIINIQSHIALAKPKTVSAYEVVSFPDQSGNKDVSFPDWSGNETVTPGPEVRGCGKTVMCDCHK